MTTLGTDERHPAPAASSQGRPARTATSQERRGGILLMLTSAGSNQTGAALGALAFPTIGSVGVVAVRQLVTALVLVPTVRPELRGLRREQWWPILGLVVVFSVMNLSLYAAIDRIGLGLAVTLEFLGPLTVAIVSSRRSYDLACAGVAGIGVLVLTNPGPTSDLLGIAMGLLAAAAWGSYILLNRAVGRRLPGLQGTAAASLVTAVAWTPIAVAWFTIHIPTATAMALAVACALMSSIVPYVTDLLALRRVPATIFGTFTSINPVWAAVTGWVLLDQDLHLNEWVGIGLIVLSNVGISARDHVLSRIKSLRPLPADSFEGTSAPSHRALTAPAHRQERALD